MLEKKKCEELLMRKTKILFVIQKFYPSGAESLVKSLIKELKNDLDIHLIAIDININKDENDSYEAYLKENNIKYLVLQNKNKINKIREIRNYIISNEIKIIHSHSLFPNMLSRISSAFLETNVIVTYHSGSDDWIEAKTRLVEKILDIKTFRRVAVSEIPVKNYRNRISVKNKVEIIKNGVSTQIKIQKKEIERLKNNFEINENDFVMTNIGRISIQKNQDYLLDLAHILKNDNRIKKNIKLFIIGYKENESIYKTLNEKINKLKLNKNVFLVGTTDNIYNYLELSDVFLFPSLNEAHPIALIEACLSKTPIVASNIKANLKTFNSKEIDILPLEKKIWIDSIYKIYSKEYFKCQLAYERVLKEYSIKTTAENYLELYKEAEQ